MYATGSRLINLVTNELTDAQHQVTEILSQFPQQQNYRTGGSNQQASIFDHFACFGYFLQQSWILNIQNLSKLVIVNVTMNQLE